MLEIPAIAIATRGALTAIALDERPHIRFSDAGQLHAESQPQARPAGVFHGHGLRVWRRHVEQPRTAPEGIRGAGWGIVCRALTNPRVEGHKSARQQADPACLREIIPGLPGDIISEDRVPSSRFTRATSSESAALEHRISWNYFSLLAGCEAALREALQSVAEPTKLEPGLPRLSGFQLSAGSRRVLCTFSWWRDMSAFELHASLPHTTKFISSVEPLIDHPFSVSLTEPI